MVREESLNGSNLSSVDKKSNPHFLKNRCLSSFPIFRAPWNCILILDLGLLGCLVLGGGVVWRYHCLSIF